MHVLLSATLVIIGGILLMMGFNSTESIHDEASRVVIARYSDRTVWYIVAGAVFFVLGLIGIFTHRRA